MSKDSVRKLLIFPGAFLGVWIFIRFLFPFFLPFLVGLLLARGAEPTVALLEKKICLPRWAAAGIAVTAGCAILLLAVILPGTALLRQLSRLTALLPRLESGAVQALQQLRHLLLDLALRAPRSLLPLLEQGIDELFSGGSAMMARAARALPGLATAFVGRLADGALQLGTAYLSAVMFSVRLPRLRRFVSGHLPPQLRQQYLPMLRTLRRCLGGWLRAQLLLTLAAAGILLAGFLLLRIPAAPLWAMGVALVDAVPMLGTGTVLVPWSLLALIRGQRLRFWGLLTLYAVTAVCRSALEPRLLGRSMGLDPLAALAAVYVGLRLWQLPGMLLLPLAVSCAVQLSRMKNGRNC